LLRIFLLDPFYYLFKTSTALKRKFGGDSSNKNIVQDKYQSSTQNSASSAVWRGAPVDSQLTQLSQQLEPPPPPPPRAMFEQDEEEAQDDESFFDDADSHEDNMPNNIQDEDDESEEEEEEDGKGAAAAGGKGRLLKSRNFGVIENDAIVTAALKFEVYDNANTKKWAEVCAFVKDASRADRTPRAFHISQAF
jgi:hypothetical protein